MPARHPSFDSCCSSYSTSSAKDDVTYASAAATRTKIFLCARLAGLRRSRIATSTTDRLSGAWRAPERSRAGRLDRLRDHDGAARHLGMHAFDHAAVDLHHALALVLRQIERRDHPARLRDLVC